MNYRFTFKHMATSDALRTYAQEKISTKVDKYVTKPIEVAVTFSVDRLDHRIHLSLAAGDGFDVQVEQSDIDMYAAVDKLIDKLDMQLRRHKEKLKNHKSSKHHRYTGVFGDSEPLDRGHQSDEVSDLAAVLVDDEIDARDLLKLEEARRAVVQM